MIGNTLYKSVRESVTQIANIHEIKYALDQANRWNIPLQNEFNFMKNGIQLRIITSYTT